MSPPPSPLPPVQPLSICPVVVFDPCQLTQAGCLKNWWLGPTPKTIIYFVEINCFILRFVSCYNRQKPVIFQLRNLKTNVCRRPPRHRDVLPFFHPQLAMTCDMDLIYKKQSTWVDECAHTCQTAVVYKIHYKIQEIFYRVLVVGGVWMGTTVNYGDLHQNFSGKLISATSEAVLCYAKPLSMFLPELVPLTPLQLIVFGWALINIHMYTGNVPPLCAFMSCFTEE